MTENKLIAILLLSGKDFSGSSYKGFLILTSLLNLR